MAGWDGNGNFVMPYSMVQQAGGGVKILSTVQDTQWNAVAAGLMNCMTLDSQTKPKADVDIATHKLINVSAPAAATDAANKSYVDTAVAGVTASEWQAETLGVAWVSTTSFSVAGVDKTAIYHAGRRVKITHNGGVTVSYGTVVSSAFVTNTTVVVAMDGGTILTTPVTAVSYGLLSYINPSYLDPRSHVSAYVNPSAFISGGGGAVPFTNTNFDVLGELSASVFTPRYPGYYRITASLSLGASVNVVNATISLIIQTGHAGAFKIVNLTGPFTLSLNTGATITYSANLLVYLAPAAGDTALVEGSTSNTNLYYQGNFCSLFIERCP